jgi:hypothetical protein
VTPGLEDLSDGEERLRQWLLEQGERHGYAIVEVGEDEHGAPYVFSVGAWRRLGVPEAVVVGLPGTMGRALIDTYIRRATAGERFMPGHIHHDFFDGVPVLTERVARGHYPEFFGSALLVYPTGDFPAVQLVVATHDGAWPWDRHAPEGFADWQPVLTVSGFPESWVPGVNGP